MPAACSRAFSMNSAPASRPAPAEPATKSRGTFGLVRMWVGRGPARGRVDRHPRLLEEPGVGRVAGEEVDAVRGDGRVPPSGRARAPRRARYARPRSRSGPRCAPRAMRFSRSGRIQYLTERAQGRAAMDEGHARAAPEEVERRLGRRALPAHHDHACGRSLRAPRRTSGSRAAGPRRERRAGWGVVVAGGDHHGARVVLAAAGGRLGLEAEAGLGWRRAGRAARSASRARRCEVEPLGGGHLAVVRERLLARRLGRRDGHRIAADLEQLGGREERHPGGEALDRGDQGPWSRTRVSSPRSPAGGAGSTRSSSTGARWSPRSSASRSG